MKNSLTDDANTTLLLCAFQGGEKEYQPLSFEEYNRVARVVHQSGKRPGDLLSQASVSEIARNSQINPDRLQWLLDRRINLGFRLEEWQRKGIWVVSRSDQTYPGIPRKRMGNLAPPLIFGTGNRRLLEGGGLAIIGPDKIPEGRVKKACEIAAEETARQGQTIIVAGHLGMAKKIVQTVYEYDGHIIWILHHGALRQRLQKSHRQAINAERLVMITMQSPSAPEESGEKSMVGELLAGMSTEILYVDGSNSSERKDQFEMTAAVLKKSESCWLFCRHTLSPEAKDLKKSGIQSWAERRPDSVQASQGQLFE